MLVIEHTLIHEKPSTSRYRLYRAGQLVKENAWRIRLPEVARFVSDVLVSVVWSVRFQLRSDIFIGLGALDAMTGVLLRAVGIVRESIYWVIDYSPKRFPNPFLDNMFHTIDTLAAVRSDVTWNLSPRMEAPHIRSWLGRNFRRKGNTQKVVPLGVEPLVIPNDAERVPHRLVFIGHVLEKQGLQVVVRAMSILNKRYADVELVVLGDGPYLENVLDLVQSEGLGSIVRIVGFVADDGDVARELLRASVGIATYLPTPESFTFYADPGKIKLYLSAGLPICLTNVPEIGQELQDHGCAVIVEPEPEAVAAGIVQLFEEHPGMVKRREACLLYASGLAWSRIFDRALAYGSGSAFLSVETSHG
ncbi:MAG: glycosyltransferase [Acidimicrobiales bacterium]